MYPFSKNMLLYPDISDIGKPVILGPDGLPQIQKVNITPKFSITEWSMFIVSSTFELLVCLHSY